MGLLLLEALLALLVLVFIVWWTLFSGRRRGERKTDGDDGNGDQGANGPGASRH